MKINYLGRWKPEEVSILVFQPQAKKDFWAQINANFIHLMISFPFE